MKHLIIECVQCGNDFELSKAEITHYTTKGFDLPKRCPDCRKKKSKSDTVMPFRSQREKKRHYRLKYEEP